MIVTMSDTTAIINIVLMNQAHQLMQHTNPIARKVWNYKSPVTRKPVFGVSDQGRLQSACAATEAN